MPIEVKGKIEKVAIVPNNFPHKVLVSGSLYKMTINEKINKHYLLCYLISKYGQAFKNRYSSNLLIAFLSKYDLYKMPIPIFSNTFQTKIESIVLAAHEKRETSQNLYKSAETQLLSALGLENYTPSQENIQVKSFKDSFLSSGRLDAEYYQPKYEEIEQKIKNYAGGWDFLGNQILSIDTGEYSSYYLNKAKGLTFFIRNTNIKNGFLETATTHFVAAKDFKRFVSTGDILTTRVGSIGSFGIVTEKFNGSVFSDNVLKIRLKNNLLPEIYTLYFNSWPNQKLMERITGGSVQPLVTKTTLKQIVIPIFNLKLQTEISSKVQKSFTLKTASKRLLTLAKTAVERAIESSEAEALAYIEEEMNKFNLS